MSIIDTIKDALSADDGGVRVHLYECQECGDQFESAKSADRAQCMECLSMDVEPVGEAERP